MSGVRAAADATSASTTAVTISTHDIDEGPNMAEHDGIFTQPGPDGLFGRGGDPLNPSAPPVDSDGVPLQQTLVAVYPSPGHMRVARAVRHPKTGRVEFQEQYRVPTPEEAAYLKERGLVLGPGSMVQSGAVAGLGEVDAATGAPAPSAAGSWLKLGLAVAVGAAGFWAVNKWVVPMVAGDGGGKRKRRRDRDDDDEDSVEM